MAPKVAEIRIPKLSDSPDKVCIVSWKKEVGSLVQKGDVLLEVEVGKANIEITTEFSGKITEIVAHEGDTVEQNSIIGYLEEQIENDEGTEEVEDNEGRIKISPLARRLAKEHGIDISKIQGSGPDGRIQQRDIEEAIGEGNSEIDSDSSDEESNSEDDNSEKMPVPAEFMPLQNFTDLPCEGRVEELSKVRRIIAERMEASIRETPHFYMTVSIEMQAAKSLREVLRKRPEFKGISINHMVIKAAAYALNKEPHINQAFYKGQLFVPYHINIGMVTATQHGLLIPVIKDVDKISLVELTAIARSLLERTRYGKSAVGDFTGATFTISNMGMYGVESFTSIISPGQGAILSVASIIDQAIVKNGQVTVAPCMKVTLAADHRVIDGVMAGVWLGHFKEALENPALLML